MRELCEELGGGLRDGHAIKAVQIGGPLGGILPGWLLDTPFDFDELAAEGCMVGHGGILAFDDRTDMRALATPPARVRRRTRAAASASRAGSGCGAPTRCSTRHGAVDRARLEALLETLELGSLCAHGGGMPAPIRSLLEHFPRLG